MRSIIFSHAKVINVPAPVFNAALRAVGSIMFALVGSKTHNISGRPAFNPDFGTAGNMAMAMAAHAAGFVESDGKDTGSSSATMRATLCCKWADACAALRFEEEDSAAASASASAASARPTARSAFDKLMADNRDTICSAATSADDVTRRPTDASLTSVFAEQARRAKTARAAAAAAAAAAEASS